MLDEKHKTNGDLVKATNDYRQQVDHFNITIHSSSDNLFSVFQAQNHPTINNAFLRSPSAFYQVDSPMQTRTLNHLLKSP